eukprot:12947790-Alexandrium_andersonii.AAC.1
MLWLNVCSKPPDFEASPATRAPGQEPLRWYAYRHHGHPRPRQRVEPSASRVPRRAGRAEGPRSTQP